MSLRLFVTFLLLTCIIFVSCKKEERTEEVPATCTNPANFQISAMLNDTAWGACEYRAVYYPRANKLSVNAIDSAGNIELRFFIQLDSLAPFKTYPVNSSSANAIDVLKAIRDTANGVEDDILLSDYPRDNVGGTFTLTSLDTATGTMNATFNVKAYSQYQDKLLTVSNGKFLNARVKISPLKFTTGDYMSATIDGQPWYTRSVYGQINEIVPINPTTYALMEIRALECEPDLGACPGFNEIFQTRVLFRRVMCNFRMAFANGTYSLVATNSPIGNYTNPRYGFIQDLVGSGSGNLEFYPLSGSTITTTLTDTTNGKFYANFSGTMKDQQTGRTIQFTNGKIHIEKWIPR